MGEERLVVVTSDGIAHLFKLKDVLGGQVCFCHAVLMQVTPYRTTSGLRNHLLDVLPNPSAAPPLSQYVALLASDGFTLLDIEEGRLSAPLPGSFTSGRYSLWQPS